MTEHLAADHRGLAAIGPAERRLVAGGAGHGAGAGQARIEEQGLAQFHPGRGADVVLGHRRVHQPPLLVGRGGRRNALGGAGLRAGSEQHQGRETGQDMGDLRHGNSSLTGDGGNQEGCRVEVTLCDDRYI
jgi:hypothetical protein